jgi:large subunit ribosomal protein L4
MAIQAPFFTAAGEAKGTFDLPDVLFGNPGSRYVLHEAIVAFQNNQRAGTSSTKTRGLVRGGGRKPWKQKGTGNARAGSIRSPLWRGGGIIFGPLPRSYRSGLNDAKRMIALQTALFEKAKASTVSVMDDLSIKDTKTSKAALLFKAACDGSVRTLLVVSKKDPVIMRAIRNLQWLKIVDAAELNALKLLHARKVIFSKSALDSLASRLPKG